MSPAGAKRPVKVVSVSSFHDPNHLKRHKGTQQHAAEHPSYTSRIQRQHNWRFNPFNAPFKTFKTQKEAFEFLDKQPCSQILRIFAHELSTTGQREFIVSSAQMFWQKYKALATEQRHHYEIIRQSSPCHLYFDLEYVPAVNPDLDGPALVQLLVSGIATLLQQQYDIPWDDSYVLELDSSTAQKFSRHLIVRLPGLAFADTCQAGRFARLVVLRLLQKGVQSWRHSQLLVQEKDGTGLTCFVDMGVFTRNRAFRLYLSSKFGKQACLRLTNRFGGARLDPKAAFEQLLISVLHNSSSSSTGNSRAALSLSPYQQQQLQPQVSLLYVNDIDWQQELQQLPAVWQQVAMLQVNPVQHIQPQLDQQQDLTPQQHQLKHGPAGSAGRSWSMQEATLTGAVTPVCNGPSPYPLLEHFILSVCNQGGVPGGIRSWMVLPGHAVLNIKNNRWCGNIERSHKSNGVYYVADLVSGVYYQKCYDPNCKNYRSPCLPLPTNVWEAYRQDRTPSLQTALNPSIAAAAAAADAHQLPAATRAGAAPARCCVQHWQQQMQEHSDSDDESCLKLLQDFEAQQQLQGR